MKLKRVLALLLLLLLLSGCGTTIPTAADGTVYVALTFDDGPSAKYTPELLDGLAERGVHATFFLVGNLVEENPELVRRMAEEGHQIGNHSYDHADLTRLTEWEMKQDIARCDVVLCSLLGESSYWVRPPYGCVSDGECGCIDAPLINWSVDPRDWEVKNKEKIVNAICDAVFDGCIVLLHDRYETSVEAALETIDRLQEQGIQFLTVEEMFALHGIEPENGKLYRKVEK